MPWRDSIIRPLTPQALRPRRQGSVTWYICSLVSNTVALPIKQTNLAQTFPAYVVRKVNCLF
jgi:hypothetical protein